MPASRFAVPWPAAIEKARLLARHMIEPGFTNGRWAVMVDKPMETASALVYSKEAGQRYPIEIVSTLAAAASFLGKDLSGQGLA